MVAGERAAHHLIEVAAAAPGLRADAGLSDGEVRAVEQRFGFEFAADHRAFLTTVLPTGPGWPNWRRVEDADLRRRLAWPVDEVLFDVEHSAVWLGVWGRRPASTAEAGAGARAPHRAGAPPAAVARDRLATVPRLVPVYAHRYVPSGRASSGHPVLSVHQTDVVHHGLDLGDYLCRTFPTGRRPDRGDARPRVTVAFWRDLAA